MFTQSFYQSPISKKTCSGPTPPPTSENEIDLTELYRRHPQLWQGFVTIKKHAAMVQLHYLSGDKILGNVILELFHKNCNVLCCSIMITLQVQSVLPVFPTMTGSDNSKHPALKVTSRVKLGKFSQRKKNKDSRTMSQLKYFQ